MKQPKFSTQQKFLLWCTHCFCVRYRCRDCTSLVISEFSTVLSEQNNCKNVVNLKLTMRFAVIATLKTLKSTNRKFGGRKSTR